VTATSDGGALLTGRFAGTVDFGGGPLTSAGGSDIFVLKLASDGGHVYSKRFGGALNDNGFGVSATLGGDDLVAGTFGETVDFGGGPLTSAGFGDTFVVKLGPDGSHVWSKRFGGSNGDWGFSLSATSDGGALLTGSFEGTVNFGGGPLASAGVEDIFVLRLGPGGDHIWSKGFGSAIYDVGYGAAATSDGGAFASGLFQNTVDFGGGPLSGAGGYDIFVLKLDDCGSATNVPFDFELSSSDVHLAVLPNPTNGTSTTIVFDVPNDLPVSLALFNVKGQRVKTLASGSYAAGPRQILWTGNDELGARVAPGVYFARLETSEWNETARVALAR
jgi:hypothetical protein